MANGISVPDQTPLHQNRAMASTVLPATDDGKEFIVVVAQDMQKIAPYSIGFYKAKLEDDDKEDTNS